MKYFKPQKVRKNIALNPIARAVAKNLAEKTLLNFRVKIADLQRFEPAHSMLGAAHHIVSVALLGIRLDGSSIENVGELVDCFQDCLDRLESFKSKNYEWDPDFLGEIDNAVEVAVTVASTLPSAVSRAANLQYESLEVRY